MVFKLLRFCAKHQVRKVHVELMWGNVGALGQVTEVAQIALLGHLAVVRLIYPIHFHGVGLINEVKQRGEGVAETDATSAPVTDIKHAL